MNFTLSKSTGVAKSDCSLYEIRVSMLGEKPWYNGFYLPTSRNVESGHDKEVVKTALEAHARRIGALKVPQ